MLSICQDLNVVTTRACGHAGWERQPPSFGQALLNGVICNLMSIPILFIVYCGVLCMLQTPCITEIFVCVNLFFLPYGNSA